MTHPPRRGRRAANDGETEQSIRAVALRSFADAGFDGTSLRDVAAAAGVDVALISYKFGSKSGLWKAIVARVGATMVEKLQAAPQPETIYAGTALSDAMKAFIAINCDHDAIPRFLLRDASDDPARGQWVFDHVSRPILDHFLPLILRARDAGAIKAPMPEIFFLSFAYGLAVNVVRRATMARLAPDLADEDVFRATLHDLLIEPHFRHG